MVGAEIDHHRVGVKLGCQRTRCAVRKRKDNHIVSVQHFRSGVFDHQISQLWDVRHVLAKLVSHRRMTGHACYFEIRMCCEDAECFSSSISSRTSHGYRVFGHVTSLSLTH